jgi:hypothetical protein
MVIIISMGVYRYNTLRHNKVGDQFSYSKIRNAGEFSSKYLFR